MGAGASISLCQTQSSVRVLKHSARVEPEPRAPDPDPRAVFGIPLSKLREAGKLEHGIPVVLKNMVEFLEKYGLQQSGVFRVCGSALRCRILRSCLDRGEPLDLVRGDVPTVAALLKLFLRELPCGLIPNTHSKRMQQALTDHKDRLELFEALKETLNRLPDDNYNILSYLLHFLSRVAAHSQWNHMTSENLATVFGPCFFRVPEGPKMLEEQTICNTLTLYLLEKHTDLMPNIHRRVLTLPSCPLADMTQLNQDQPCNLGSVCNGCMDKSQPTDHDKDINTKADLTASQTQRLNSSDQTFPSSSDKTEVEKRRREEERQVEAEPPSPNHNNNNTHSHNCHAQTPYSNTPLQSCGTPATETSHMTNSRTEHTHAKTRTKYIQRHTYTPNRDTQTKTTCHTHSGSRKTLPQNISSHSERNHTHTLYSSTDSQSGGGTHSDTSNSAEHTHSRTKTKYIRSHTYTPNRDTHTKTTCYTHSRSSDTLQETSSSHSQTNHTHSTESIHTRTADTRTEEKEASPLSSCEQPTHSSRAPVLRSVGALPSPQGPVSSQNLQLSSEQVSASSSQSHVTSDCISSGNSADSSAEQSVSLLQSHIHNLKQAVRSLDDSFQYTQYHKAEHNDKVADRNVATLMVDLDKACKQLRELRSRQCVDGSKKLCSSSTAQQVVGVPLNKPALEDTVKTLTLYLKEKRLELNLPENLQDMSLVQLALEKMTLQKSLLYYESLHGRPRSKEERSVMRDLYDRYRLVKQALYTLNTQTNTISEDKGLDELIQQTLSSTVSVPTQEASNPAFISQLEEVKLTTPQTNNTHSVNRTEVLKQLKETKVEKRRLRKILKEYEETVLLKSGRSAQREDRVPMAAEYDRYKTLKARLKLLKRMLGQTHTVKAAR